MNIPAGIPTPYPEVNRVLERLSAGVRSVLGEELVGLYLHGSLASGDFNPRHSDIDFLAVTRDELPGETIEALAAMHRVITASGLVWATKMEGSYIPLAALRRYDPAHASHPALRYDGSFDVDFHASDWIIQRHEIRKYGLALCGPPAKSLIDPISADELRQAARGILLEWWAPMLQDPQRLESSEYQTYAVLTMCRILYTIEAGDIISKPGAAAWAQERLGAEWARLIAEALAWGRGQEISTSSRKNEVLELIRYTLAIAV